MENVITAAGELLGTVLMALSVFLFGQVKEFLTEKISLIQGEQERKIAENALKRTENIVELTVKKIQQTVVNDMKERAKDGKLSGSEIGAIKEKTAEEISKLLNEELYHDLKSSVADVDLYMRNLVEAKVLDLKKDVKLNEKNNTQNALAEMEIEAEIV